MNSNTSLAAIREESSGLSSNDEYEDITDESSEGDDDRIELQSKLQLSGNQVRMTGLKELRELYQRVSTRLTKKDDTRLKKAENKIASFLDEDDVKEKKELQVFEKLEQLTGRPSFGSRLSLVEQFKSMGLMDLDGALTLNGIPRSEEDGILQQDEVELRATTTESSSSSSEDEEEDQASEEEDSGKMFTRRPSSARNLSMEELLDDTIDGDLATFSDDVIAFEKYRDEEETKLAKHRAQIKEEKKKLDQLRAESETNEQKDVGELSTFSDDVIAFEKYRTEEETKLAKQRSQIQEEKKKLDQLKKELGGCGSNSKSEDEIDGELVNLSERRTAFETYRSEEEARLGRQRAQIQEDKRKIDKLKKDMEIVRTTNAQYASNIAQLENKLKTTHLEWSKKVSSKNLALTKMRKQVEEHVKEKADLKEKLAKFMNNNTKKFTNPLRPTTQPQAAAAGQGQQRSILKKTIHFQSEEPVNNENNKPRVSSPYVGLGSTSNTASLLSSLRHEFPSSTVQKSMEKYDQEFDGYGDTKENENPTDDVAMNNNKYNNTSKAINMETMQNMLNNCKLDDTVETAFPNGTRKYVSKTKQYTKTLYKNGDIKEKRSDGSVHYFFSTYGLRHYVYPNGLEMTTYKNGQVQRKNPDGTCEILYQNGCVKIIRSDATEEFIFPDNTVYQTDEAGNTTILLPNGQKEIQNQSWKKRLFPDGTTKTVYADGTIETTYSNGRTRVKNAEGKLIMDEQKPKKQPGQDGNNKTDRDENTAPANV